MKLIVNNFESTYFRTGQFHELVFQFIALQCLEVH